MVMLLKDSEYTNCVLKTVLIHIVYLIVCMRLPAYGLHKNGNVWARIVKCNTDAFIRRAIVKVAAGLLFKK
jgi:hypothetical protein